MSCYLEGGGRVSSCLKDKSGLVKRGQFRSRQVKSGQGTEEHMKLGQVKSGQVKSLIKSDQFNQTKLNKIFESILLFL